MGLTPLSFQKCETIARRWFAELSIKTGVPKGKSLNCFKCVQKSGLKILCWDVWQAVTQNEEKSKQQIVQRVNEAALKLLDRAMLS